MSTPPQPTSGTALPQEPAQPGLSESSRLINAFVSPRKTFEDVRRKPGWFWPWLLIAIVGLAFAFVAIQKLDMEQLTRQATDRSTMAQKRMEQFTPEQRDAAISMQAKITKAAFFISPVLTLFWGLIIGAVLMAVFDFGFGASISFRHALSVTFYSFLPGVISVILLLVSILISSDPNSIDFASGNPIPTSPAFFMDPNGNKFLYSLVTRFDIINFWQIALLGLGFAIVSSVGRKKIAPSTAITTVFVLYFIAALVRAGLATVF
ncbi:MAG TPA: Yip1 family protein [Candidatus Angelobacter sp.]|nr:Yip1 family protein [Candidatus Angelobacter sp.]